MKILEGIASWMSINAEGIYSTRPWSIFGTDPSTVTAGTHEFVETGGFNEEKRKDMTAEDVRFTTRGKTLYAFVMGWPASGKVAFPVLGINSAQKPGKILNVELMGHNAKLNWKQDESSLSVQLPAEKPCPHAVAFKIERA